MLGLGKLARKVFGTTNDRKLQSARALVDRINALEPEFQNCSDDGLSERTVTLRNRVLRGEPLDKLLPEAFANCREAARRSLGLRAFDVQLMGGFFLHQGNIAEMLTGEGKTLVATFPAYLNALAGKGVHVVTVNDYLAKRDAEWMGRVYAALGMTASVIFPQQFESEKRAAYSADITYATHSELGFDYLRDNMKSSLADMVQRGYSFAIVDEVDSILIDEARTPLVISGPSQDRSVLYKKINAIISRIQPEHFMLDKATRRVTYTDEGNDFIEHELASAGLLPDSRNLYDRENTVLVHHALQALRAHQLYRRDQHYIVRDNEVTLIDEFTGRAMRGRRLSDGLHQAIEAKEGITIRPENTTLASVTFQNYFRLYDKLSGMTGTAATDAVEFGEIYGLEVIQVPANCVTQRKDGDDRVHWTAQEKLAAVADAVREANGHGQPVLVGTTSIEKSEQLSARLQELGILHRVLNARQNEQEAAIIADAGRLGAVTIATNMAGRGTDIQLAGNFEMKVGQAVAANPQRDPYEIRSAIGTEHANERDRVIAAGGLLVVGTERHESRRIDNQLRGRAGRQGDPGLTVFFLSLEDDLLRTNGPERLDPILSYSAKQKGKAINQVWFNVAVERAQSKCERRNFEIRAQLLKFDNVMNDQRKAIFSQRLDVLQASDLADIVQDMRSNLIANLIDTHLPSKTYVSGLENEGLALACKEQLMLDLPIADWAKEENVDSEMIREHIAVAADAMMEKKAAAFGQETMHNIEKQILLKTIDQKWREHLLQLEQLRSMIGFRVYGLRNPLVEYKSEAFALFESMLNDVGEEVTRRLAQIRPLNEGGQLELMSQILAQSRGKAEDRVESKLPDETEPTAFGTATELALSETDGNGVLTRKK